MSIVTMMSQLGAHLKNLRKVHALREHARLSSSATYMKPLMLINSSDPAYTTGDHEENRAYIQDGTHLDDVMVPQLQDAYVAFRDSLQDPNSWFGVVASELALNVESLGDPIEYVYTDVSGEIRISKRLGPIGALYAAMVAQKYVVVASKITTGTLTGKDANVGELEETETDEDVFFPNCPSGTLTFICTDATISAPKFSVRLDLDTASILADGTASLEGENGNELQAEKPYTDGPMGINGLVLSRPGLASPDEFNDDANLISAITVEDPHEDDCDEGKFYFVIARDATHWIIQIFRTSAREAGDIVGQEYFPISTGTEAVEITCGNGTVIAFTFSHDNALVEFPDTQTGEEIDLYIDIGHLAVDDEFTMTLTNDEAGNFSSKLKHAWRAHLPSGPAKPSSAPVDALAGAGAGNVDTGDHNYRVSFVSPLGESGMGPVSGGVSVPDPGSDGKVVLSSIPTGPAGTTARKIYRSFDAGVTDPYQLVGTVSGNVTTTFQDNVANANRGAQGLEEVDEDYATSVSVS